MCVRCCISLLTLSVLSPLNDDAMGSSFESLYVLLAGAATSCLDEPSLSCLDRSQRDRVDRLAGEEINGYGMLVALYSPTRDQIEHNGAKIKYESRFLATVRVSAPASVRASARVSVRVFVRVSAPASVRMCAPASVRVSAPASVRVSAPASVRVSAPGSGPLSMCHHRASNTCLVGCGGTVWGNRRQSCFEGSLRRRLTPCCRALALTSKAADGVRWSLLHTNER